MATNQWKPQALYPAIVEVCEVGMSVYSSLQNGCRDPVNWLTTHKTQLWTFTPVLMVSLAKTWRKTVVMRKRELLYWSRSSVVALMRRQLWAPSSTRYHWLLHLFLPACSSSRRFLLSMPKWGQGSEVSRESNDNCDIHFANRCIAYTTTVMEGETTSCR